MNQKIITYLFLSSLAMNSCAATNAPSQSQSQDISQALQQASSLDLAVVEVVQDLLNQGYSIDQIVEQFQDAFKQTDQQTDGKDKDDRWKWVGLGLAATMLGVVAGWYLCKHFSKASSQANASPQPNEEHLVQEVLRVGGMLAEEQTRSNQLERQIEVERRAREVLQATNQQNELIIQGLNLVINNRANA